MPLNAYRHPITCVNLDRHWPGPECKKMKVKTQKHHSKREGAIQKMEARP